MACSLLRLRGFGRLRYIEALEKWPVLLMVRSLEHGGCERDAAKLAVGLDRSCFIPHVAIFVGGGARSKQVEQQGIPIVQLPVRSFRNTSAVRGAQVLRAYMREHRIQLIQCFDVPTCMFAPPVARMSGVPVVISSQLSYRNMCKSSERMFLRLTDKLSDRVVVNSRAVGDSLVSAEGLPKSKVYLCYNGVETDIFKPGPRVLPPALRDASLVVGTVCVMRREKRVDLILRAFARLRAVVPGARLLLVGSGAEDAALKALHEELGLAGLCHFAPAQTDVVPWMRCLDVYINSSNSESFPNGLLEAMACGCCVIGSAVGGIPELITHGKDGLTFALEDLDQLTEALRLVLTDTALRQRLRDAAVETAQQRFSMQINVDRNQRNYLELLEQKAGTPSGRKN